jgi:hypothetical protein
MDVPCVAFPRMGVSKASKKSITNLTRKPRPSVAHPLTRVSLSQRYLTS